MRLASITENLLVAILLTLGAFFIPSAVAAPVTLVADGKSTYTIMVPANAPASVQSAAEEFQRCVTIATGVALPLVQDDAGITGNVISIGSTIYADQAGIDTTNMPVEGFRIVSKEGSLYIIGQDTPTGERTKTGGVSSGSANGVYTFLENYLGARWLMPGDLGRDVPQTNILKLEDDIDIAVAPYFESRRLAYTAVTEAGKIKPGIGPWHNRQKLGYSFRVEHNHNWEQTVPAKLYAEHPEWFPMIDSQRPAPQGNMYKLETTNPEVVQRFADRALATLKANPEYNTFSLSPSDGFGWSQSPESLAMYDKNPDGGQSLTPLILKFYSDVSKAVAAKDPNAKLAGYIYNDYLYPPSNAELKLPDNFYPVLAGSISYSFRLYREPVKEKWVKLLQDWSKVAPHLYYYDLPNTYVPMLKSHGTITPTTPEMLNFMFKHLTENKVKGLYIYGDADWGYGALSNYIWARMIWDPKLDAYEIQKDWLLHAYGAEAGTVMNDLYLQLEQWQKEFYNANPPHGHFNTVLIKGFYGVHYAAIEEFILKAQARPMNEAQQKRFQLIENNLIALQWRLRNDKILPAAYQSAYTRTDEEATTIVTTPNPDFDVFPNYLPKKKP